MPRRRTLHLPALLGTLAAAVLLACAGALLAVSREADATFPDKNGKIAYESGGVIYSINPDGSGKIKVTNTRAGDFPIDHPIGYSPTGKKITHTSYDGTYHDTEIYTIKVGGSAKINVTDNKTDDFDSSYSPNAKRIAYAGWDGHDLEIYTIDADGTGKFQVTNNGTNDFTPSYSSDGKKVVFSGKDRNNAVEIYTIGVHGKNRVQLTNNATYDYYPDYSPDGRRIAFSGVGEKSTNIYTISARGVGKSKVTEGSSPSWGESSVAASPPGEQGGL